MSNHVTHPASGPDMLAAALLYAAQGLAVFPLAPGTKRPFAGSRGSHDATTDVRAVEAWWTAHPTANIAIATGRGLDVLDLDGPRGIASWLDATDRPDPVAVARTPGGVHLYLRTAGSPNRRDLLPGIDYRGLGGYVVAPPSVLSPGQTRDGRPGAYSWGSPLAVN